MKATVYPSSTADNTHNYDPSRLPLIDTPGSWIGREAGQSKKFSTEGLKLLISGYEYPVFIAETQTGTILSANQAAKNGFKHFELQGRLLKHILRHKCKLDEETTLAYFNGGWLAIQWDLFKWEGISMQMVSLKNHGELPEKEQISNAKDMIAVLLHRLRSPLTGIQGYMDLVRTHSENDQNSRHFDLINSGMQQVAAMLEELETMHADSGQNHLENIHFKSLTRELISRLNTEDRRRMVIREDKRALPILTKKRELQTIMDILIRNAVEHASGKDREIIISQEGQEKISITNFGKPLSEYLKKRAFSPFMTDKVLHMGLGLTRALLLITALGGALFLTSNSEKNGITFTLLLPPANEEYRSN